MTSSTTTTTIMTFFIIVMIIINVVVGIGYDDGRAVGTKYFVCYNLDGVRPNLGIASAGVRSQPRNSVVGMLVPAKAR